jgi:hypothetical protein
MRESFDLAFTTVIGEEGHLSSDSYGGFTVWGLASHYYPQVTADYTMDQAKAIYLTIWTAAGCDTLPYPMDIAVFDSAVNPGPGATATFLQSQPDLEHFMRERLNYYCQAVIHNPDKLKYLNGWILRVLRLWTKLEKLPSPTSLTPPPT